MFATVQSSHTSRQARSGVAVKSKPCKYCESVLHTSLMCFQRPRPAMKSNRKLLNRVGPVTAKWIETRNEWIQQNATPSGTWVCTYCPKILAVEPIPELDIEILTLDHIKPKSEYHELRYELSNLTPSCWDCNSEKGTKELEEFLECRTQSLAAPKPQRPINESTAVTTISGSASSAVGEAGLGDFTT